MEGLGGGAVEFGGGATARVDESGGSEGRRVLYKFQYFRTLRVMF